MKLMMFKTMLMIVVAFALHLQGISCSLKYEKLLHKDLLNDYNPDVRPEPAHNQPVEVHLDVRVKKLIKLDVREQVLLVSAFTMLRWTDPQLAWKASKYDGVNYITMGTDLIWTPDVMLYNTADDESNSHTDYYKTKATIYRDGDVMWIAPVTWKVSCTFDVTWFPVDQQSCNMTFGSWTYSFDQLQLVSWIRHEGAENHEHFMVENGEWKILETSTHYQNLTFACCSEPYSTVHYEVRMSRLSLYYFMYILLPLMSLAVLFLIVFFIPYNTGERMGFGVTILLSITVYLLVISEELPEKSDDKSMLGICFIIEFYLLCLALVLALITTNLSRRETAPPTYLIKLRNKFRLKSKPVFIPEIEMEELDPNGNRKEIAPMKSNKEQWYDIASTLDIVFFIAITFVMAVIPLIVTSNLDSSGLGSV